MLLQLGQPCMAGDGGVVEKNYIKFEGSKNEIASNLSKTQQYVSQVQENTAQTKIVNIISLSINEENAGLQSFNITIPIKIEYGDDVTSLQSIDPVNLQVSYDPATGVKYNARQSFSFEGAKYIKLTINTLPAGVSAFLPKLLIQSEMQITRWYNLSNTVPLWNAALPATADELPVNWQVLNNIGNNGTQLEWSWLDDDFAPNFTENGIVNTALLFADNSTRIDLGLETFNYNIPLLYEGPGKLYYRLRFINNLAGGGRSDGPWSIVNNYAFAGHQSNLNWQSSTTYAEEGKRKTVVSYFDGGLRSRQTVTKNNTDQTTITAETMYDYQGRPALQILPAPGINNIIQYNSGINQFNQQTTLNEDPAGFFDLKSTIVPDILKDNIAGSAAQYYSAANTEKLTKEFNKNIPDAEGYPYSLTRYTPDATGRVLSQTGVGAAFTYNNTNPANEHVTKYFYGAAGQEELDALFGTEVGDFTHYAKNMVRDANGQMSVSYTDMHGRTIATALAGLPPSNMQALVPDEGNYPGQSSTDPVIHNLLSGNNNLVKTNGIEAVNTFLVPFDNLYTFNYSLTASALQMNGCNNTVFCKDCMYTLEIALTDDADEIAPMVWRFNNVKLDADENCTSPVGQLEAETGNSPGASINTTTHTITIVPSKEPTPGNIIPFQLPAGSYTIRKTLTPSEVVVEKYKTEWAETLGKGICQTEQEMIDAEFTVQQSITHCDNPALQTPVTCSFCSLTTPHSFDLLKRQMLADMTPGGQYALASVDDAPEAPPAGMPQPLPGHPMFYKYNIFSTTGGAATQPHYLHPKNLGNGDPDFYLNAANEPDPVLYAFGETSSILPATKTPEWFGQNFNSTWANQLLRYHPEYKSYEIAAGMPSVYNYMDYLTATTTYADAQAGTVGPVTGGFVNTVGSVTIGAPYTDPFYINYATTTATLPEVPEKTLMQKWVNPGDGTPNTGYLDKGFSMWQLAVGNVIGCNIETSEAASNNCYLTAPTPNSASTATAFNNLTTDQKDAAWEKFKALYTSARTELLNKHIAVHATPVLTDDDELVREGYILHFPKSNQQTAQQMEWPGYPSTDGQVPTIPADADDITDIYANRCNGYIDMWKQKLLQCDALANMENLTEKNAILTEITNGMVAVCEKGSDQANPFGSSNVAPATPVDGSPRSFEDVIVYVYKQHGIIDASGIYTDGFCNPFVINYPTPYGKGKEIIPTTIATWDNCNCKQLNLIKQEANAHGHNGNDFTSFNAYLNQTYNQTITQELFDETLNCSETPVPVTVCVPTTVPYIEGETPSCSTGENLTGGGEPGEDNMVARAGACPELHNSPQCVNGACTIVINCQQTSYTTSYPLSSPQLLPRFLQCGYSGDPLCVTCEQLSAYTAEFKALFSPEYANAPYFGADILTDEQITANTVYQRFVNYRAGINFTWQDYKAAAQSHNCNVLQPNTGVITTVICGDNKPINDVTRVFVPQDPCVPTYNLAVAIAQNKYKVLQQQAKDGFEAAYRAKCLQAKDAEAFTVSYQNKEYHYTLYYYDQAGNLVKTIPPKGARPDFSPGHLAAVKNARAAGSALPEMPHELPTRYCYNSLNAVIEQKTPDANASQFWYDALGRLVASQNAKQATANHYSYTDYDELGRIREVGELTSATTLTDAASKDATQPNPWFANAWSSRTQITHTSYDDKYQPADISAFIVQENLRSRVSWTAYYETAADVNDVIKFSSATFYTYDVHGNVNVLAQNFGNSTYKSNDMNTTDNLWKRLVYDYDLISGKVNAVDYQPPVYNTTSHLWDAQADAFYHRYVYDAENRLTKVYTSRDKVQWEQDASYFYYKHGPLARTELGALKVQGLDYTYTLQGWLKGVNIADETGESMDAPETGGSTTCAPGSAEDNLTVTNRAASTSGDYIARTRITFDDGFISATDDIFTAEINSNLIACVPQSGGGGSLPGSNHSVAKDAFSYVLNYYGNDYKSINNTTPTAALVQQLGTSFKPLYNGNIAAMGVSFNLPTTLAGVSTSNVNKPMVYNYGYDQLNRIVSMDAYTATTSAYNSLTTTTDYKERYSYNPDGGIVTLQRNGAGHTIDNATWNYGTGHQLDHINDPAGRTGFDAGVQAAANYAYNGIGEMTDDQERGVTGMEWNVYGKLTKQVMSGKTITFTYDASNNRISKKVSGTDGYTEFYARDAQGNIMAIYRNNGSGVQPKELYVYGSSRLGSLPALPTVADQQTTLANNVDATQSALTRGDKTYELSDHRGNVMITVTDKAVAHTTDNVNIDYYYADVAAAQDYSSFGALLESRQYGSQTRFTYNGKEQDKETGWQDYGMRPYLGGEVPIFAKVDPLQMSYPWNSPYAYAENEPISNIDLDGLEKVKAPGLLTKLWNAFTGDYYKTRAQQFAADKGIDESNVYYLNGSQHKKIISDETEIESGNGGSVVIYQPVLNKETGETIEYKHVFYKANPALNNLKGLFKNQDALNQKWDLYWDDDGNPMFTPNELSLTVLDAPIPVGGAGKAAKGLALMGAAGKTARAWTIYQFIDKLNDFRQYTGMTVQYLTRIGQHAGRVLSGSELALVENLPNKNLARGIEQLFIEYGRKVGEISNKINSINPKNKAYNGLMKEAIDYLKKNRSDLDFLWEGK